MNQFPPKPLNFKNEPEKKNRESVENESPEQELISDEIDQTRISEMPFLYAKGFAMGSADVVPGVSGGTMALILGIYTRLIFAVKSVDIQSLKALFTLRWSVFFDRVHLLFLISVFFGGVSAVLFFTKVIKLPVLMHSHPEIIYGLFFGLISGSILLLLQTIGKAGWRKALAVLAGTLIGFRVVTLVPAETPETHLFVFFSGALSITAMVLPGISGSFILLILQKYDYILGHIGLLGTDRTLEAIWVLTPFGLGMVFGLVLFVRILSWLLKRFHILTVCLLMGFMAGSLYVIWPYQEREFIEHETIYTEYLSSVELQELKREEQEKSDLYLLEIQEIIPVEESDDKKKVQIREVRRRLVNAGPYWPKWFDPGSDHRLKQGAYSLYGGLGTMLTAFFLVAWLGKISRMKMKK